MSRQAGRKQNSVPEPDTSEFDVEFVVDTFAPLSSAEQARWKKAKQRGKIKNGTAATIQVKLEGDLLARADALANRLGISRSGLIIRGLKAVLAAQGEVV